jgi:hypothetical protein
MSKVPPAAMFRLPADRPSNNGGGPIIEPSQQFCPHWLLVVAHQAVREIYYMSSDVQRQLCGGCFASTVYRPIGIKKRVLFVRHGQGAHNQTIANWGLVDPELTAEGEARWEGAADGGLLPLGETQSAPRAGDACVRPVRR